MPTRAIRFILIFFVITSFISNIDFLYTTITSSLGIKDVEKNFVPEIQEVIAAAITEVQKTWEEFLLWLSGDDDNDTIKNEFDQCPNTPNNYRGLVDDNGCRLDSPRCLEEIRNENNYNATSERIVELNKIAEDYFNHQLYESALNSYLVLYEKNDEDEILKKIAETLSQLDNGHCAIQILSFLDEKNTDEDTELKKSMLEVYKKQNNYKEVIRLTELLLLKEPENIKFRIILAIAHTERGNLSVAETHFKKILEEFPRYEDALSGLGKLLYIQGEYSKSINYYLLAIEVNPNQIEYYEKISTMYLILGDYNNSINYSEKILELDPNNFDAKQRIIEANLKGNVR